MGCGDCPKEGSAIAMLGHLSRARTACVPTLLGPQLEIELYGHEDTNPFEDRI